MTNKLPHTKNNDRGSALIFALGMLVIFVTLGTIYVREMNLELEKANYSMAQTRARAAAEAGINAASAEMERAVQQGDVWEKVGRTQEYRLPIYKQTMTSNGLELLEDESRVAVSKVVVSDESGKININHAGTKILMRVLGVDEATARRIRGSLPRGNAELNRLNNRRWLGELEDLVERGFLTREQLAQVDRSLVTTFTVEDHDAPGRFLNINTAPVGVLEILFNLGQDEAEKVAVQRPFTDFQAIKAAVGKDPATFAFSLDRQDSDMLPEPFRLESRCFRLKSEAYHAKTLGDRKYQQVSAYAEAVVLYENDGTSQVLSWSARRSVDEDI